MAETIQNKRYYNDTKNLPQEIVRGYESPPAWEIKTACYAANTLT